MFTENFDPRLRALADCAVIPLTTSGENKTDEKDLMGGILFNPYPTIVAANNLVLSHEVCHRLAGKKDYDIFKTALVANSNFLFKFILNLLYDWYHEIKFEGYSPFLKAKVRELHEMADGIKIDKKIKACTELYYMIQMYSKRNETPESVGIKSCHDIVFIASKMTKRIKQQVGKGGGKALEDAVKKFCNALSDQSITGAGASSYGQLPIMSNYYAQTVAKYSNIINSLKEMWTKNKYDWIHRHYGEIDWKNLIKVYMGEKLELPVFLILSKVILQKNIHLLIDRSSSTDWGDNKGLMYSIMDTAIIITESLRQCNTPISILEVGVENKVINKIDQPLNLHWFTPMAENGTPIGEVCLTIEERSPDSLLLIITDGEPNDFNQLQAALKKFPGDNLTFVIGESYPQYATRIENAVSVEPYTIIKELMFFIEKGGQI